MRIYQHLEKLYQVIIPWKGVMVSIFGISPNRLLLTFATAIRAYPRFPTLAENSCKTENNKHTSFLLRKTNFKDVLGLFFSFFQIKLLYR